MMYTRLVSTLAALCVFLACAGSAQAAEEPKRNFKGLYAGIGAGPGIFADPDDVEDAWRLLAWWRAHDYGSFEIGYIDAGDPDGVEDFDGLHLALVPTLPLRDMGMDVFAKIGGFFHENSDIAMGIGAAYHFPAMWILPVGFGIRLDWDRLNVDDKDNIDVVTLALFYQLARQGK